MENHFDKQQQSLLERKSPATGGIFTSCVDSIKEGWRKINVCKDLDINDISVPAVPERISALVKYQSRGHSGEDKSFDAYLNSLPVIKTSHRVREWIISSSSYNEDCKISLDDLPLRGTLLPTRYAAGNEILHEEDTQTSVSLYDNARGTHNKGTPPKLDPTQLRLDEIYNKLQQSMEREARQKLIAAGERHLLSYNLMDVYSHQVTGYPLGTTPELLPFVSISQYNEPHKLNNVLQQSNKPNRSTTTNGYLCKWYNCYRHFQSAKDLMAHIENSHMLSCGTVGKLLCRWKNCNKTFNIRYKLLLHIHHIHCREALANERKV